MGTTMIINKFVATLDRKREAAGTEVITLTMRKWLSRAPEKPGQFLSPSEGGQPEVGGDISAQGCRVRHKMNQGNSVSSLI